MKAKCVAAVMIHVPDWKEGLAWYQRAFPEAKKFSLPEFDFEGLELNGIKIEVVNAHQARTQTLRTRRKHHFFTVHSGKSNKLCEFIL